MTYNHEHNYCSLSPDTLFGVNFNYACYLHDRQYRNEVKERKTREETDVDMKNKIFNTFSKKGKPVHGFIISWLYYIAVRSFSWPFWVKAK